jgi:putative ABC transport system permease protein
MIFKIPLAWLQLTREKLRLLVALAGIGFASMLMFTQLGFRDALYDSALRVYKVLDGDLFLISPQSQSLIRMESFSRRRLYEVQSLSGIESVKPFYAKFGTWKDPWKDVATQERSKRSIMVFAFDPQKPVFNLLEVNQKLNKIVRSDVVLFDRDSRRNFGPVAAEFDQGTPIVTEVNNRKIQVGGLFSVGTSFGIDASLITSDVNFIRIFKTRKIEEVDLGIIHLKPGTDVQVVTKNISAKLPNDVKVMNRKQLEQFEKNYWANSTSIGFIFNQSVVISFIVGAVIVYQILYSDVADHLPEYATLKAMGYKDSYLLSVVFKEAIILAILGYMPGFAIASFVYSFAKTATLLPLGMTLSRALLVLVLTIAMCLISGGIAVRKVQSADPADVF